MAQTVTPLPSERQPIFLERNLRVVPPTQYRRTGPILQAATILRIGFSVAPIIAGIDKFFHSLVDWDQYLAPQINNLLGGQGHGFMLMAGVIEIIAGLGVAVKPKIFGYVVSAWLLGIVVNLLISGQYYDIALRDFGLCLGAFALARLSQGLEQ